MARNGGLWSFRSGPRNHRYSLVGRHDADGSADDARFCATRMSFLTARLPRPTDATRTPFPSSAPALAGAIDRGVLLGEQRASKTRGQGSNPCAPAPADVAER